MSVSTVSSLPASPEPFMSSSQRQGSRSGPSVRAAWVWENRKASSRWYWVALVVLCTLGMASGSSQYVSYRDVFDAQGASWLAVWGQATLLPSMMFIPLLVGALIAQIAAGEHAGRNWQRMNANRLQDAMILGKILHMAQVALLSALVLLVEFVITGLLLGFDPAGLGPYAERIVAVLRLARRYHDIILLGHGYRAGGGCGWVRYHGDGSSGRCSSPVVVHNRSLCFS